MAHVPPMLNSDHFVSLPIHCLEVSISAYCNIHWHLSPDGREQETSTAHQYNSSLLWCNESQSCRYKISEWNSVWHFYGSLQLGRIHAFCCYCWSFPPEIVSDGIRGDNDLWFNASSWFNFSMELVWEHWEVACKGEVVVAWCCGWFDKTGTC